MSVNSWKEKPNNKQTNKKENMEAKQQQDIAFAIQLNWQKATLAGQATK